MYLTPKWIQVCPHDVARAVGVGAKKFQKNLTLMGAKFAKKGTFKRLFLTKFEFSVLTLVKIVKIPPKNLLNPTLMGTFRACETPSLWVQIFEKHGLSGGTSTETQSTRVPPPPGRKLLQKY